MFADPLVPPQMDDTPPPQPWDGVIPAHERELYRAAGFGHPSGCGSRPALLIVDVQYRTIGFEPLPIREAIKEFPTSCGEAGWAVVPRIAGLLGLFRDRGLPVIFPHIAPKSDYDIGQFCAKAPSVAGIPDVGYKFVAQVAPAPGDMLVPKHQASAFSGTSLASYLVKAGVDTLIVTGCTTSGCIRATVVDASSLNYKVIVPHDAVFDRSQVSHAVNLFDMASKYADVVASRDVPALIAAGQAAG